MALSESRISKTFVIRSPFIIVNKTNVSYMLRIDTIKKTTALAPGESYALNHDELKSKIRFARLDDFEADAADEKGKKGSDGSFWSGGLKVSNFYHK